MSQSRNERKRLRREQQAKRLAQGVINHSKRTSPSFNHDDDAGIVSAMEMMSNLSDQITDLSSVVSAPKQNTTVLFDEEFYGASRPVPAYASEGAAMFDIASAEEIKIPPHQTVAVSTGLKLELPHGTALFIYSRSGMVLNHSISVANAPGIIDSDYRGEVKVLLHNGSSHMAMVAVGDRIAQGETRHVSRTVFTARTEATETVRGDHGFGSTGLHESRIDGLSGDTPEEAPPLKKVD